MIKPAYSVSFLLSINIFVWQKRSLLSRCPSCIYIYIYTHTHTYTYSSEYRDAGQTKEVKTNWDSSECRVPRKFLRVPFWALTPYIRHSWSRGRSSRSLFSIGMRLEATERYEMCVYTKKASGESVPPYPANCSDNDTI